MALIEERLVLPGGIEITALVVHEIRQVAARCPCLWAGRRPVAILIATDGCCDLLDLDGRPAGADLRADLAAAGIVLPEADRAPPGA